MVAHPSRLKRSSAFGPAPHRRPIGRGARNSASPPALTTTRPSGLSRSLAILAMNFDLAQPIDAVSRWRYEPGRYGGEPVEVEITVVVDFILN